MYTMNNLAGIEAREKLIEEKHVVIILFLKPSDSLAEETIKQFNYYHHLASRYCSIYAAGFINDPEAKVYRDKKAVEGIDGDQWWYSDSCFVEIITDLERRLKWRYTGEPQILMLQSNPEGRSVLNFQNYVELDLADGIRKNYIDSIPRLLNSIIRESKKEVEAVEVIKQARGRIKLRQILELALDSGNLPKPVNEVLKDKGFYMTSIKKDKKSY